MSGEAKRSIRRPATLAQMERELQQARQELRTTRDEMQISQEELKSANEELQSTNEELQSTNEELTTSKEEMQSMNEELQTLNHELKAKVDDLPDEQRHEEPARQHGNRHLVPRQRAPRAALHPGSNKIIQLIEATWAGRSPISPPT